MKRKDGIGEEPDGGNGDGNIEWIDVGLEGLLNLIPGLPKGDAILVRGEPGTGKTILCLQFLHKGAEKGEKGHIHHHRGDSGNHYENGWGADPSTEDLGNPQLFSTNRQSLWVSA